ncbi:MAG: TolC family protein [Deltaproteobacteria bacterium]|nr:TolC family protein [Deltaproteobacteria bacterium]
MRQRDLMKAVHVHVYVTLLVAGLSGSPRAALAEEAAAAEGQASVLSLEEALATAKQHNPDLAAMQARVDGARTAIRKAWSYYLPQVSLGGSWTMNSTEASLAFPNFEAGFSFTPDGSMVPNELMDMEIQKKHQLGARLEVQQPIFVAPLIPMIAQAGDGVKLAELGAETATREILFGTFQAYLFAAGLKEAINLGEEQVALIQKHARSAEAALAVDMASELQVLRAKIEVGKAEQELARTRAAYDAARGGLATLLARKDIDFEVERPTLFEGDDPEVAGELEALLERSRELRPELESTRIAQDMGARGKQAVWAKFLPTIGAGWTYTHANVQGFSGENGTWALMAYASIPLYDGGLRYAELKEADAKIREAEAQARSMRLRVRREVRQARLDIQSARANLAKAQEQVVLARANWEAVEKAFAVGASSAIELSDASTALRGAELMRISEEINLALAQVSLRKAVGLSLIPR